jgi:hypothetical protein
VLKRLLIVLAVSIAGVGAVRASATPGGVQITVNDPVSTTSTTPTAAPGAGTAVSQTLAMEVKGGTLSTRPSLLDLTLQWDGVRNRYRGRATFDVVDARGTLAGWAASVTVQLPGRVKDGVVSVRPLRPAVVDGAGAGLAAGPPTKVSDRGTAALGRAAPGNGGGTYRVAADLEVSGVDGDHPGDITVSLATAVR